MYLAWSHMDEAWRDTLIHKAERSAFADLCKMFQLEWVRFIPETSWRRALKKAAYAPRDLFASLFAALEAVFSSWDEVFPVGTVSYYSVLGTHQLYRAEGWGREHVNRFVRIGSKLYWSLEIYGGDAEFLRLCPYGCDYWDKAAFGPFEDLEPVTEEIRLLPFRVYERSPGPSYPGWDDATYSGEPCLVEVIVLEYVASVPETWLLAPEEYETATQGECPAFGGDVCPPEDYPPGGYLLENDVDDFPDDVTEADAYPVYLHDNSVSETLERAFRTFAPVGVDVELRLSIQD